MSETEKQVLGWRDLQAAADAASGYTLKVVGVLAGTGWRFIRVKPGEKVASTTYPVDAFLATEDGRLIPVAYEPRRGTVYLDEEAGVILLRTTAAQVYWEG